MRLVDTADPPAPPRRPLAEDRVVFALQILALVWAWPWTWLGLSFGDPIRGGDILAAGLVVPLTTLGLLLVLLRARAEGPAELGLTGTRGRWRRALVVGVLAGGALSLIAGPVAPLLDALGLESRAGVFRFEGFGETLAALVGAALLGGVAEELVYRGFLMSRLEGLLAGGDDPRRATLLAALVTSIAFGAQHAYQGEQAVVIVTLWGLGLATLRSLCRRRLLPVIVAHATLDVLGVLGS